ncbi:MAG: endonuclease, partial [Bacteroidales bacterium]|nr:endonuclease [Bacteroidales bacterium]
GLKISDEGAKIFNPDFLFEEDMKYLGIKPFRTYSGPKYQGGFSDHLPIYLDLIFN